MFEFLTLQMLVGILGTASIGTADWLYLRGRVRRRLHSLWVACSSTAICLPVLTWIANVFLGLGSASLLLIGTLEAMMFFWIYHNLQNIPAVQQVRSGDIRTALIKHAGPPSSCIKGWFWVPPSSPWHEAGSLLRRNFLKTFGKIFRFWRNDHEVAKIRGRASCRREAVNQRNSGERKSSRHCAITDGT
jgi:hypothetical protein